MIQTKNLTIRHLKTEDAEFILRLTNDPDWLTFIGDKGIRSEDDAVQYLNNGPIRMYALYGHGLYFVGLKNSETPIGICGIIKRESLPKPDLGFAFLPDFRGNGYAFEAADAILNYSRDVLKIETVLAITLPENLRSIRLLEKLGFQFSRHLPENDHVLNVFEHTLRP